MANLELVDPLSSKKRINILVIDDDAVCLRITKAQLLEICYCRVEQAVTLTSALRKVAEPYDIVFTDMRLPDGSGIDFIRAYRDGAGEQVPVVVISTDPVDLDTFQQLHQLQVETILQKPVSIVTLEKIMERYCEQARRN